MASDMEPPNDGNDDELGPLGVPAASDRCPNCHAPLASDQRYCINCGERRGRPRFAYQQRTEAPPPAPPKRERRIHAPAGMALIAGVATLLLAMGVGVLIGQDGSSGNGKTLAASAPQVITVNGGAGTGAVSGTSASGNSTSGSSKSSKSAKNSTTKVAHLSKKVVTKVNQAATNVIGNQAHLAPAQTKLGGKCTNGEAGCVNGKFTGQFFSGG